MNIIKQDLNYNYLSMIKNLTELKIKYPFLEIQTIAKSNLNKDICTIKLGKGKREVLYAASFHANEWITSLLLMKFIEDYAFSYTIDSSLFGYSIRKLFNEVSIYILPMINPDGVDLVTDSIAKSSLPYLEAKKIAEKFPEIEFPSGWKANIRGESLINFHLYFEN